MGSERWYRDAFGGTGEIFKTIAAASLIMALLAATSRAGDISSQPGDSLSVTNSVTSLLPQGPAGTPPGAAPAPEPPPPGGEQSWLSGLHISGYGSQTFGMWQNPTALKDFTPSRNNLAVARTLLQVDENYRLNENNTFFMREWFTYEPPYSYNSANNRQFTGAPGAPASLGHLQNSYYNVYQVRDAWWENKTGPLTTFIGNQIVVWGQSLAFRVGDVINPADTCWAFGFANLEQSRDAQWMIHPILNLPEWGPFTSNFLELVVQPGFQPRWWEPESPEGGDPEDKYRSSLTAGRAIPCPTGANHGPSARFDIHYQSIPNFPFDAPLAPLGPYASGGATGAPFGIAHPMIDQPAARQFFICLPAAVRKGFNPYLPFLAHFHPACHLGLSRHQGNFAATGDGSAVDIGFWHIPGMQPENWNEGVRFHTLYGATEWTALYYNDATDGGGPQALKWAPPFYNNLWKFEYPEVHEAGVTVDRPLPVPASIAEYFPAVFRGEMLYTNHQLFNDSAFHAMEGIRYSDTVKYMLAIDLDQAYAPWLTSTGNLSANFEMVHTIIMDNAKTCTFTALDSKCLKNDVSLLLNFGTSWWWSDFSPTWTMIFNPKGRAFALFPSIVLNPPWTKKYFMKLQAIEIMGGDNRTPGLGLLKGQSYLIAQFQYNFNLM